MAEMSFVMKAISTLLSSLKRAVKENPTVGKSLPTPTPTPTKIIVVIVISLPLPIVDNPFF